jgi:excisionase family DNA binding protein
MEIPVVNKGSEELLTIKETAELLNVSTVTIGRWLKQGRLTAYRLGPRQVRVRRADLAQALITITVTSHGEELETLKARLSWPLSDEEKAHGLAALERAAALRTEQLARRGVPFSRLRRVDPRGA